MLNHGDKLVSLGLMAVLGVFAAVAFGAESRGAVTAGGRASPREVIRPSVDAGAEKTPGPAPSPLRQPARARAWRFAPEEPSDEAETEAPSRPIEVRLSQAFEAPTVEVEDASVEPEGSIHTELGPPVFVMNLASLGPPPPSGGRGDAQGVAVAPGYAGGSYGYGIGGAFQALDAGADAGPDAGDEDLLIMYSTEWCHVSRQARLWMLQQGIEFDERDVEKDAAAARRHAKLNPRRSVPTFERSGHSLIGFSPASLQYFLDATQ